MVGRKCESFQAYGFPFSTLLRGKDFFVDIPGANVVLSSSTIARMNARHSDKPQRNIGFCDQIVRGMTRQKCGLWNIRGRLDWRIDAVLEMRVDHATYRRDLAADPSGYLVGRTDQRMLNDVFDASLGHTSVFLDIRRFRHECAVAVTASIPLQICLEADRPSPVRPIPVVGWCQSVPIQPWRGG